MNWSDLTHLLTLLAPIVGVIGAVLGIMGWLMRSHVQHLKEQLAECKRENLLGQARLAQEEARGEKIRVARDESEAERIQLRERAAVCESDLSQTRVTRDRALKAMRNYYNHAVNFSRLRDEADREISQLKGQLAELSGQRVAADKLSEEVRAERDRLAAALSRARGRTVGLRKQLRVLDSRFNAVARQDGRVWQAAVAADAPAFVSRSMRKSLIVSVLNLKGGVGKTTITANLAGLFGEMGKRVLMIDLDHQRSLSQMLLPEAERKRLFEQGRSIQHFLQNDMRSPGSLLACAASVAGIEGCSLIINGDPATEGPKTLSLDDVEMHLMSRWVLREPNDPDVRFIFREALHSGLAGEQYDIVLLDCPPRLTTASINALAASDFVLIPVQPDPISLRSVPHLLLRLKSLRAAGVIPDLEVLGVLANMVPTRAFKPNAREVSMLTHSQGQAEHHWGHAVRYFETMLTRHIYYADASRALEVEGKAAKLAIRYPSIRKQYQELAKEIESVLYANASVAGVSS